MSLPFAEISPEEAARHIMHGQTIGFSGFTPAGAAKVIPKALAAFAKEEHAAGRPFKVNIITGASTGDSLDGELARAEAVGWRTPYQSSGDLRKLINAGKAQFFDMHLSNVAQNVRYGFLGKVDFAIVEACDIDAEGNVLLTTSVGVSPTLLSCADKVLIELNRAHSPNFRGLHDIFEPADPPARREVPIYSPSDRVGEPVVKVDPKKIIGIVTSDIPDETAPFKEPDPTTMKIGENVADFLAREMKEGRIPPAFLPIQSGVGNIANAVLGAMGAHPDIPPFQLYSEVIQDSVIDLMLEGRVTFASGTSLTLSTEKMKLFNDNLEDFKKKIVLRPQEISNNPEVARRIGIVSINTAIEADIFGNINSTHVLGKNLMNGIGGSGDFTRNAYISIFTCPSIAKGGKISTIVPLVAHMDHSEHSVQAIVTEQGYASLRLLDPMHRAAKIITNCAHPDYHTDLTAYFESSVDGHTPQTLGLAFAMHQKFMETGDMRGVDWGQLTRLAKAIAESKAVSI